MHGSVTLESVWNMPDEVFVCLLILRLLFLGFSSFSDVILHRSPMTIFPRQSYCDEAGTYAVPNVLSNGPSLQT